TPRRRLFNPKARPARARNGAWPPAGDLPGVAPDALGGSGVTRRSARRESAAVRGEWPASEEAEVRRLVLVARAAGVVQRRLDRLVDRLRVHVDRVGEAIGPVVGGAEGAHERMASGVVVRLGVPAGRSVAAAHVTAGEAEPQLHPLQSLLETFLAAVGARLHRPDLAQMRARHGASPARVTARR